MQTDLGHRLVRCNRPEIIVACILDEFSYECFKYECLLTQLHEQTWRTQLEALKPDFLLVESAWRGLESSWKKHINHIEKNAQSSIKELIQYCREEKIPTVFWNKEDPPHYSTFIGTARLFDWVFTTDENCVKRYIRDLGHKRVHVLPFAAQPAIHNPVNNDDRSKDNVAFAGTWYTHKYSVRQTDMEKLLSPARKFNLHIYDRNFHSGNDLLSYPTKYHRYIVGSMSYDEMVDAYKRYKVFLNVNTVRNSPTMCSRRMFELLASGTNVISSYSLGTTKLFGKIVPITRSRKQTRAYLTELLSNSSYRRRLSLLGVREVNERHLYEHRFNLILEKLGYPPSLKRGVSVITFIDGIETLESIRISFEKQAWRKKELILLIGEKVNVDTALLRWRAPSNVRIISVPNGMRFAKRLKTAIDQSKYDLITLFHEEDYYGPYFLTDLIHAFQYTDAQITGKCAHYSYSEFLDRHLLYSSEEEYKYVERLQGSSMVFKKEVFSYIQLNERSENGYSNFLKKCVAKGIRIFAADPYNYVKGYASAKASNPIHYSNGGDRR